MRSVALVVLLTLTLALAACGGVAEDGVNFSLEASRTLESLSTAEVDTICSETTSSYEETLDQSARCYSNAALFTKGAQDCQAMYQDCLTLEYGVDYGFDCMVSNPEEVKGCQATVDELSRCTTEMVQNLKQAANQSCNGTPPSWSTPSCTALMSKCPSLR